MTVNDITFCFLVKIQQVVYTLSFLIFYIYKRRNPHNKKLVLQPVTEEFVLLMPIKVTGLDEIPVRFIKYGANVIKVPSNGLFFLNRGLTLAYFMLWGTTPVVID
jgi:hypothetical protein